MSRQLLVIQILTQLCEQYYCGLLLIVILRECKVTRLCVIAAGTFSSLKPGRESDGPAELVSIPSVKTSEASMLFQQRGTKAQP